MTVQTYDFENGTDGAALTSALTGGTVYGDGTYGHYSSAGAMHGSLGCVYVTADLYRRAAWNFTANTKIAYRFYYKITSDVDATTMTPSQVRDSTNGTSILGISLNVTSGTLELLDSTGAPAGGTHITVAADTWYRVEVIADSAAGSATLAVYEGDSTTAVNTLTSSSGLNFGAGTFAAVNVGLASAQGMTKGSVYFDDVAWNPGGTSEIGPYVPPVNEDGAYLYTGGSWVRVTVAS